MSLACRSVLQLHCPVDLLRKVVCGFLTRRCWDLKTFTPGVQFFTHIWGIYDLGVASLHTRCRDDIDERAQTDGYVGSTLQQRCARWGS